MIDISSYRCRIGCFQQKLKSKCDIEYQVKNRKHNVTNKPSVVLSIVRAMLLLYVTVSAVYLTNVLSPTNILPVQQPAPLYSTASCYISATSISTTVVDCIIPVLPAKKYFGMEDSNFLARYTYGNKREHGIRILHWNKGSSYLENKTDDVDALIQSRGTGSIF